MTTRTPTTAYATFPAGFLPDGSTGWDDVRVTLATKIAWEKSARANKWTADDNPFTVSAFFSWHAARLAGLHELTWEAFLANVVEAGIESPDAPDPTLGEDPTQTAPFTV